MASTSRLSLAWSGDFDSLKEFICKTCDFVGNWSQPGGDKKVYSFNDDSSISWRKSKKVLSFNGPQACQLMRDLCKRLSEQEAYTSDFADEHFVENAGQSSKSVDIDMEIEDLKAGQMQNGEAIKALSDSILGILPVISDFQAFIDRNIARTDKTFARKSPDTDTDRAKVCVDKSHDADANSGAALHDRLNRSTIDVDIDEFNYSNVFNRRLGHIQAEHISQLDDSCEAPSRTINETLTDSTADRIAGEQYVNSNVDEEPEAMAHQETYAQVVKSIKNLKYNEETSTFDKSENTSQNHLPQRGINADGFIGVDRRRKRTKKFFISGIHESVKESQILSYLEQRNITPTHISLSRSQRMGTRFAKIHIPSLMGSLVQTESFWPKFVKCRLWQPKTVRNSTVRGTRTKINTTHLGEYSTYV